MRIRVGFDLPSICFDFNVFCVGENNYDEWANDETRDSLGKWILIFLELKWQLQQSHNPICIKKMTPLHQSPNFGTAPVPQDSKNANTSTEQSQGVWGGPRTRIKKQKNF